MAKEQSFYQQVIDPSYQPTNRTFDEPAKHTGKADTSGYYAESGGYSGAASISYENDLDAAYGGGDYSYGSSEFYNAQPAEEDWAAPSYWYNEKAKFEAAPYVNSDNPGYQNPDGFKKDFVDMIVTDIESKNAGTNFNWYDAPNYTNGDPTFQMIKAYYDQNHPEAAGTEGQTGQAFQEQPLQDPAAQVPQVQAGAPVALSAAPITEQTPNASAAPAAPVTTPAAQTNAPATTAPVTVEPAVSAEKLMETPAYKEALSTFQWLGMDEEHAKALALETAQEDQIKTEEASVKGINWAGLGRMGKNSFVQNMTNAIKNVVDIEADILGLGVDKAARDAGDASGLTFNRQHYFDLMDQGYKYYQQQTAEGNQPAMSRDEFAEKYAEYSFRVETNDRYNPSVDLTDFQQYMPEGTASISGNPRLEHSADYEYEGNPVNSDQAKDPQAQALMDSIKAYVYQGEEGDLSNNLDSIMNNPQGQEENRPLTQNELDEIIMQLVQANPTEDLQKLTDFSQSGSMDQLDTWMKQLFYYAIPGTQNIEGSTGAERWTQPLVTSFMSAGLMANIGEIAGRVIGGPVGARAGKVIGGCLSFGMSYAEQAGLIDLPYYNEIMEFFDKGADIVEGQIGRYSLAFENAFGYAPFQDAGDYYRDLKQAIDYRDMLKASWKDNEQTYSPEVWDILAPYAADLGVNFGGSRASNALMNAAIGVDEAFHGNDPEAARLQNANEVYRFNLGQAGKVVLDTDPNERFRSLLNTGELMHRMGMSDQALSEWAARTVTNLMGTNTFLNEVIYNEAGDPLNLVEGNQANIMYGIGAINNDTNMMTAARANGALDPGAMALSLLPSGADTVVTQIAKIMGDEIHHAGGFNEVMNTYDIENQFGNRETTTRLGERMSGITQEGKVSGLEPTKQTGLNILDTVKNKAENFVNKIDDARILYLTDTSDTMINMGLANAQGDPVKISAFLDELQNPDLILPGNPLYDISQSAMFNTYKEDVAAAVTAARGKADAILNQWSQFDENRKALDMLSQKLGMTPDTIIDQAENSKYNLAKLIEQKAEKDPSILFGVDSADVLVEKLTPFLDTDKHHFRVPWNPTELAFQLSNTIGDSFQQVMLDKYNIQPKATVYRLADTVKAVQNFVFLGISGTYLANNVLNNVVTRGLTGVGGFSPMNRIENYFTRMGIRSERFGDSLALEIGQKSSGEKTQYVRMQEALSSRREAINDGSQFKKALKAIKKGANEVNQMLGIFGNLSGKVEEAESKQAIYSGTKQYMDRTWKPGVNLTRMPGVLEAALDAQAPGMKDAIYSAVRNGLNMKEITNAILGDYVQPGLKESFLTAAAERYGSNAENIVGQLLDKTGLLDELKDNLEGKDAEGRQKVFEEFSKTLEIENAAQVAQHLVDVAESIKADVTREGFDAALEHASEMVDTDLATRLGSMNQWDKEFALRLREPFTVAQWQKRVNDLQQKINAQYQQIYAEKKQVWDGILQGLGMNDKYKAEYVKALGQSTDLWEAFYKGDGKNKGQEQYWQDYRAKAAHIEGENEEGWRLRAQTAYSEYLTNMETLYDTSARNEMAALEAMDKAFADGMRAVTGLNEELNFIDQAQAQVRDLRQQEIDLNKRIREQERTLETYSERDLLWKKNEAERRHYRGEVARIQKEMYRQLKPFQEHVLGLANDPASIDYDAIVRADIGHQEAQKIRTAADKYADRAWERIGENRTKMPDNYLNLMDAPTVMEAEDLFKKIDTRLSGTEGYNADDMLALIYTTAGLSDKPISQDALKSMSGMLTDDELTDIMTMSINYSTPMVAGLAVMDDIGQLAEDISNRVYPKLQFTNETDAERKRYNTEQKRKRDLLYNDISVLVQHLVEYGQAEDPELFHKVNNQVTAQDWQTMNAVASKYNAILNELNAPAQPDPARFHTEQLQKPETYANYNIVAHVMDGDQVIALVPDKMPITEINYSDDVKFQVLGISPDDPQGIVYMLGDEPRTASPKTFVPEANEFGGTAWSPAMDVNTTPTIDPGAMANQELLYKDVLPLLSSVADRYEGDLLQAQTQKLSDLDDVTRGLVKSYLDNIVAKDLSNAKYKAMRYGEMMRDIALLNYSDRYGFDAFLTMIAPYQFWMTRSMNQWVKRMLSHPRLYSHYQRVKEIEEKNEKDYLPSRLVGKVGIPLVGWPSYLGGRTYFNPSQLLPINTFFDPLEQIDDDKHVAEKKAMTLLEEWLQSDVITYDEYTAAQQKTGQWWDMAYAEASEGKDLDPDLGSLWSQYFSANLPVNWAKAAYAGTGNKLAHFPSTNVGNALAQLVSRIDMDNPDMQQGAQVVRNVMSAPERALRDAFGFEYKEFGAYADALISRRLRAMMTDGEISKADFDTAWMEKDGNPIYDKAVQDVRQEISLKVPGYGLASGILDGAKALFKSDDDQTVKDKWLNVLTQLPLTPFSQYTFAQGEETERRSYAERSAAYDAKASGENPNAVNEYYDKYPAGSTYQITNKPSEDLQNRYALYDIIKEAYYGLDDYHQQDARMQLGDKFYDAIINPETRAIETMPIEDLVAYARALNGTVPYANLPFMQDKEIPNVPPVSFAEDKVLAEVKEYDDYKKAHFPGIQAANDYYWDLPDKRSQNEFLAAFPMLKQYWDWNKTWKAEHEDAAAWLSFRSASYTERYAADVWNAMPSVVRGMVMDDSYDDEILDYFIEQAMTEAGVSAKDHDVTRAELQRYAFSMLGQ